MRNTSGLKRDAGPGRPKGSKDKFPRSAKAAVTKLLEDFGNDTKLIGDVLMRGLRAKAPSSFPYLRMIVEQHVGAPDQSIALDMSETLKRKVVHELHPGPNKSPE